MCFESPVHAIDSFGSSLKNLSVPMNPDPDHLSSLAGEYFASLSSDPFLVKQGENLARRSAKIRDLLQPERIPTLTPQELRDLLSDTDTSRTIPTSTLNEVMGPENERADAVREWLAELVRTAEAGLNADELNDLRRKFEGLGQSFVSELLMYRFPERYWKWSDSIGEFIRRAFEKNAVGDLLLRGKKSNRGEIYFAAGKIIERIKSVLDEKNGAPVDFLTVDLFMRWGKDRLPPLPATADEAGVDYGVGDEEDDEFGDVSQLPSEVDAISSEAKSLPRIWLIATGNGGDRWNEFLKDGSMQISFSGMGDLRRYASKDAMAKQLSHLSRRGAKVPFQDSLACYQFLHEIKVGDVVVAKAGTKTVLGYGIVTGPYEYTSDNADTHFSHRRSVEWKKTGNWPVTRERKLVTKTLTDITKNKDLLAYLEGLFETDLPPITVPDSSPSYWWLNCNPANVDITNLKVGDEIRVSALNDQGQQRKVHEYFFQARPGDFVVGYETTLRKRVAALLQIVQSLTLDKNNVELVLRKIDDPAKELYWNSLLEHRELAGAEPVRFNGIGSLSRLTKKEFEHIITLSGLSESTADPDPPAPVVTAEEVAEKLFIDPEEIARWTTALNRKGQIIFYGPPGTGKTFTACEYALHLIGGGRGFIETVQFHPAYSYEDFMQGIRPAAMEDGTLSYRMTEGVFMNFCRMAEECGDDPCVLILDEINRANLSRVFGELMYLIEYRDRSVRLAGNGREFRVPENVRIIGTMNTADRSIALVDHALRRRFAFIELRPEYDVLRNWHRRNDTGFDAGGLASVLQQLNGAINDPHYEVGISFFLLRDVADQIEHIWRMEIEPYLGEYFLGRPDWRKEFGWDAVRARVAG